MGPNPTQGSIILYLQHRLQRPVPFCKFGLQRVVVVRPVYRDQKHPPVFKWKEEEICDFMGYILLLISAAFLQNSPNRAHPVNRTGYENVVS